MRNRLVEANNEKEYGDSHKILIENNINKIIIYSDSKFGTVKLQGNILSLAGDLIASACVISEKYKMSITLHKIKIIFLH